MKFRSAWLPALAFCLTLGLLLPSPVFAQEPVPVTVTMESFFAPAPSAGPFPIEDAWLRELNDVPAGATIRITLYSFTLESLRDALIAASQRKVTVQVIADKFAACFRGEPSNHMVALYQAGIPVMLYRNRDFPQDLMHHKFFVIDDRILATGSCNFTRQGTHFNHENTMIIKAVDGDVPVIQSFREQFDLMWDNRFPYSGHEFVVWTPSSSFCSESGSF